MLRARNGWCFCIVAVLSCFIQNTGVFDLGSWRLRSRTSQNQMDLGHQVLPKMPSDASPSAASRLLAEAIEALVFSTFGFV